MATFGDPACGTPGCIAGHAAALWGGPGGAPSAFSRARKALGLTTRQATQLFYPGWAHPAAYDATPGQAARVLDLLLETGRPRWDLVLADGGGRA